MENRREQALQDMKNKSAKGIPIVLFGKALYGSMVEEYLHSEGLQIADVFIDDHASEAYMTYDEVKKKHHQFIVVVGFIRGTAEREEKVNKLKSEQMLACYYLDIPFPSDKKFINWQFLEQNEEILDQVYDMLSDEPSKEIFIHFLAAKVYGNSSILSSFYCDQLYFAPGLINISEKEIFLDCGAFDGDTLEDFLRFSNGKFQKYYALEPDLSSFHQLKAYVDGLHGRDRDRIILIKVGAYNERKTLRFKGNHQGSSHISSSGGHLISAEKIDDIAPEATFVKMDIEGSELMALDGARQTIRKNHPQMAISVYHKSTDLLEIPLYIKSLVPEYKMYLRHHAYDDSRQLILYVTK